jgi:hypothetical protein
LRVGFEFGHARPSARMKNECSFFLPRIWTASRRIDVRFGVFAGHGIFGTSSQCVPT